MGDTAGFDIRAGCCDHAVGAEAERLGIFHGGGGPDCTEGEEDGGYAEGPRADVEELDFGFEGVEDGEDGWCLSVRKSKGWEERGRTWYQHGAPATDADDLHGAPLLESHAPAQTTCPAEFADEDGAEIEDGCHFYQH